MIVEVLRSLEKEAPRKHADFLGDCITALFAFRLAAMMI